MDHCTWYAFKGRARLAEDAGVSKSAITRLLNGQSDPSYALVTSVRKALELRLGRTLDPRELISYDGSFPTPICRLVGCKGCLPNSAYDHEGKRRPEFRNVRPGEWMGGTPPAGYTKEDA
jgi:transcriptional regulator with XRE-family HTH domain